MMNTIVCRGAIGVLLVVFAACGGALATSPTGPSRPAAVPPTDRPPLSGPFRTFSFERNLLHPVAGYTNNSRFVLYDTGAFVLRYEGGEYRGRYTEANGDIVFDWEGWSVAGPWGAIGTLKGDLLTVQYNLIMQLSDFEDAVYVLVRS
jgi:hypothetical protein